MCAAGDAGRWAAELNHMSTKPVARILLLMSFLTVSAPSVYACECDGRGSPRKELRKAGAVFTGEIVEIAPIPQGGSYLIKFKVMKFWKGVKEEFVTVQSPGGLCGIPFNVGEAWLVYAYGRELWTDNCRRTKKAENAAEDLQALGRGKLPKTKSIAVEAAPPNKGMHPTAYSVVLIRKT